jgi:hypothetical protein
MGDWGNVVKGVVVGVEDSPFPLYMVYIRPIHSQGSGARGSESRWRDLENHVVKVLIPPVELVLESQ